MLKNASAKPTGWAPLDVCIIGNQKRCRSSKHRRTLNEVYQKFSRAYHREGRCKPVRMNPQVNQKKRTKSPRLSITKVNSIQTLNDRNGYGSWPHILAEK